MTDRKYEYALGPKWLTPFYDSLVEGPMSAMRDDLLVRMGDLNGKSILDIGCGTGTLALMIKQAYPAADVFGLDGDPQILEIARRKAQAPGLAIHFEQGMSFALPYPEASFDVLLTTMMLHHLERDDKQRTAVEMYRVLRPGGRLFGIDFAELSRLPRKPLRFFARRYDERLADNLDGFLPAMFQAAGFQDFQEPRRYWLGTIAQFQASKN